MVVMAVAACVLFPCGVRLRHAKHQRAAKSALEEVSVSFQHEYEWDALVEANGCTNDPRTPRQLELDSIIGTRPDLQPYGPVWLRNWFGDDITNDVVGAVSVPAEFAPDEFTPVKDQHVADLADIASLRYLYLNSDHVTNKGVQHLARLQELEELSLWCPLITDSGVESLVGLKNLKILELAGTSVTHAGINGISGLPTLERLAILNTQLPPDALTSIGKFPELRKLELHLIVSNKQDSEFPELRHLSKCKSLEHLVLSGWAISSADICHLAKLPKLRYLDLTGTAMTDEVFEQLATLRSLETLDLTNTRLSDEALNFLASALPDTEIKRAQPSSGGFFLSLLSWDPTGAVRLRTPSPQHHDPLSELSAWLE